ncbi:MAG: pilus assembly protein N-terminal domain-containing protein, partial [Clostridia bacterium]|nr:pilus assembly protein N-terminal domain-containing protein [Clostridia bacterium]
DDIEKIKLSYSLSDESGIKVASNSINVLSDTKAEFTVKVKGLKGGKYTLTVDNGQTSATCSIAVVENEVKFEEDSYTFALSNGELETEPIKLIWKSDASGEIFDPDKLTLLTNDEEIAEVEDFTYSKSSDDVEILIEITPLKNGECILSASYEGAYAECEIKVEKADIMVYTTKPSLMLDVGEKMGMGFALSKDGKVEEWKNMAIVVSNPTVVDVSDYIYSEQGYYINFTGKTEGTTTVTVTDSDSGAYVTFLIKVASEDALCRSYKIDKIPEYYPEIWGCRKTETNFYDVSGLYVNQ